MVGQGTSELAVQGQLRLLEHRGPDASGIFASGDGAIGQTRLAVIDLFTGDPPMTSEHGALGAVLNGELYNFRSLKQGLELAGHVFSSEGDTEVIAHLAEDAEPEELARRLDGMFAFATWDTKRRRLVLGRDRLGKKPLYYWCNGGTIVFASEIKGLLANPAVPRRMDNDALPAYLTFGYVPTPRTFFEGVYSVPPGHVLVFEAGSALQLKRYWDVEVPALHAARSPMSLGEAGRAVRSTLSAAVERRLISDVPLGAFLSGGLDSSSVVALMAGFMDQPVATFTIGFDDKQGFDERPYARLVATRYKTDHTEFVINPDASSLVERLVWHFDQPFGDSSALATYLLSELTRKHVTVALAGDGGDELFGGYERFAAGLALSRFQQAPAALQRAARRLANQAPPGAFSGRARSLQRLLAAQDEPFPEAFLSWVNYVPTRWQRSLCPGGSTWGFDDYDRIWEESRGASMLDRLLLLNLRTYLLDDLLPKVDRMAMAHALEVRSPFLDTQLLELAFAMPSSLKIRGFSLKRVLKAAMSDALPAQVLHRRKRGFGLPLGRWFRDELRCYLESRLLPGTARVRSYLRQEAIDQMVAEHLSGAVDHSQALWALVTLEEFLRKESW